MLQSSPNFQVNFKEKALESNLVWSLYLYVFIILALCVAFYFTKKIGPNGKTNSSKDRIYESGIVNYYGGINSSINVKYYLVAIVFVIFDIEAVFMYPWAVSLRELGLYALVEMFVFMGILLVGLYYIYKKKILRWE